ncbi:MAG: selenide, water dikinase SelD [Pseudomonadales bacterium]|nr:selenide, water dikinase SelD [Pseudomonadales bacterium]
MNTFPLARELVLVGGGHSHVIFLRMLAMNPLPGLKVTLISPDTRTPYSGMLPGMIAGHYSEDDVHIDLVPLCRFAGADLVLSSATGIDTLKQEVAVRGRPDLRYDMLSLDIGSTPSMSLLENKQDQVVPVKPISNFLERWQRFLARYAEGGIEHVGFVGAGAGGIELCLAVNHYLTRVSPLNKVRCHVFTSGKTILEEFSAGVRIRFEKKLVKLGIDVHREFLANDYREGQVNSVDGRSVPCDEVFWVTQAGVQSWPEDSGLAVDERGFVTVKDTLQSVSHENIFAVGDCAAMINHPRPKAGVYAVRQGAPLFHNVCAYAEGKPLKNYKPQSQFLSLISTGDQGAVASRNGLSAEGAWVWRWKNWIDQRFMVRFNELPEMPRASVNDLQAEFDDQMQCGGCGSKVASDLLSEVLGELMPGDVPDDDAVVVQVPDDHQLLQSVDHFRGFVNDPYLQARIAVCHALSDIYACGGKPLSVLASITLPHGKPDVSRSLLTQLMHGSLDQLKEEGARLIGGHTSEGMELSVGFTVNGAVKPCERWGKGFSKTGNVLVLTKPLGTGALFAADMQYRAQGDWIASAIDSMLISNRRASQLARQFSIDACTDVTGFGLAGHLQEMITDEVGVMINLDSLPRLPGAKVCLEALGIRSTLHDANRRTVDISVDDPSAEILFDPQTAGGLLLSVAEEEADRLLEELRAQGYESAVVIGHTVSRVSGSAAITFGE